jgi:hypothetical protein
MQESPPIKLISPQRKMINKQAVALRLCGKFSADHLAETMINVQFLLISDY